MMGIDIITAYEEATYRYGVAESLPPTDVSEKSNMERLKLYTKNKENRDRFTDEIEELKNQHEELIRLYHDQLGKARARTLGREFRDMELEEASVGIYDGQVVATASTESGLHETLSTIMPAETDDHPYIYHYAP
jgi:hypothetical protein